MMAAKWVIHYHKFNYKLNKSATEVVDVNNWSEFFELRNQKMLEVFGGQSTLRPKIAGSIVTRPVVDVINAKTLKFPSSTVHFKNTLLTCTDKKTRMVT
jgi:hypothetical protein